MGPVRVNEGRASAGGPDGRDPSFELGRIALYGTEASDGEARRELSSEPCEPKRDGVSAPSRCPMPMSASHEHQAVLDQPPAQVVRGRIGCRVNRDSSECGVE